MTYQDYLQRKIPRPGVLLAALIVATVLLAFALIGVLIALTALSALMQFGGSVAGAVFMILIVPILMLAVVIVGLVLAWMDKPLGRIIFAAGVGLYVIVGIIGVAQGGSFPWVALLLLVPAALFFTTPVNLYYQAKLQLAAGTAGAAVGSMAAGGYPPQPQPAPAFDTATPAAPPAPAFDAPPAFDAQPAPSASVVEPASDAPSEPPVAPPTPPVV